MRTQDPKLLDFEDTARAMAAEAEDWSDWECVAADGLSSIPWATGGTETP